MNLKEFNKKYQYYKNIIDLMLFQYISKELKKEKTKNNSFIKEIYKQIWDYLINWGKRLRPILSLVFFEAFSKKNANKEIQKACLLFEFFHNYTLIHDDIYDEDEKRRNLEAVHFLLKKYIWGNYNLLNKKQKIYKNSSERFWAVWWFIAWKLVHNLSIKLLNESKIDNKIKIIWYNLLSNVYEIDNIWQALDLYFEYNINKVKELDYFNMINLKTCQLIINSCIWWASLAKVKKQVLDKITNFALLFWEAFQIHDDIIDLQEGSNKWHGFGSDLKQWKKTLIVIHFFKNASDEDKKIFNKHFWKINATKNQLKNLVKLLNKTNSITYATNIMQKKVKSAILYLDLLKPKINKNSYEFLKFFITNIID